ncbi:histidine kinase [Aestuariibacter halophilus]|uniref:Histidine kinase n=1 Tax=Fluctibacter halophilus TaxID=226011 RepID=A0ABS8GBL8_9ALTE|nr:histidine kinase [Aestuariibacter halophilus]MCC2617888.1 histidine kinase [Aestuariibacter halophilus]
MLERILGYLPRRPFFIANVFFWLAFHALFTNLQYRAMVAVDTKMSWLDAWLLFSPWYFNWIWIAPLTYAFVRWQYETFTNLVRAVLQHALFIPLVSLVYFPNAVFFKTLIVSPDMSYYWENLTKIAFQLDILLYGCTVFVSIGICYVRKRLEERVEIRQLQAALLDEQLKSLHSQLNPHFLFNALNTVASLVRLKREKEAVRALSELSNMLRKILEHKNSTDVKLRDEVAFIDSYLAIQKLRFTEKLDTKITIAPDCLDIEIPNMILHPLVENAVQHGSQLESNKNLLSLDIRINSGELNIRLTNKVAKNDKHEGFGIGLTNTRERLSRLYSHYLLELRPLDDDLFETLLAIPIGELDA